MKPNSLVLSLLFPGLLIRCSSSEKSSSTTTSSKNTPTIQSSNKNQPVNTDVYKPKELGDWHVTLLPLEKKTILISTKLITNSKVSCLLQM